MAAEKKKTNEKKEEKKEEDKKSKKEEKEDEAKPAIVIKPLEAAARRLERLLGGGLSAKDRQFHTYSNPTKVVRRWLGTASGAAGDATFATIAAATTKLLDPDGSCATGHKLLLDNEYNGGDDAMMETEEETTSDGANTTKPSFLTTASCREVESWLLSLQIRLLWKERRWTDALTLVEKSIAILLEHLRVASTTMMTAVPGSGTTAALFPLLARMYRYRSLIAESLGDNAITVQFRQDMVQAHNLACLRRDVDCQATLLNLMLRDLLLHSQGKSVEAWW